MHRLDEASHPPCSSLSPTPRCCPPPGSWEVAQPRGNPDAGDPHPRASLFLTRDGRLQNGRQRVWPRSVHLSLLDRARSRAGGNVQNIIRGELHIRGFPIQNAFQGHLDLSFLRAPRLGPIDVRLVVAVGVKATSTPAISARWCPAYLERETLPAASHPPQQTPVQIPAPLSGNSSRWGCSAPGEAHRRACAPTAAAWSRLPARR